MASGKWAANTEQKMWILFLRESNHNDIIATDNIYSLINQAEAENIIIHVIVD